MSEDTKTWDYDRLLSCNEDIKKAGRRIYYVGLPRDKMLETLDSIEKARESLQALIDEYHKAEFSQCTPPRDA